MEKDYRIRNQKDYLYGSKMKPSIFTATAAWSHEHCCFCWANIDDGNTAYTTEDTRHWVCEKCYSDFKKEFMWE